MCLSSLLQYNNFIGPSTQDFYKAASYLNEVQEILKANPDLLNNPKLYKSVYCFLVAQEINELTIFIGRIVASFKESLSTFIFREAFLNLKESVNEVNKYCIQ